MTRSPTVRGRLCAATGALAIVLFGCGLLFVDLLSTMNYPAVAGWAVAASFLLLSALVYRALAEPAVAHY